MCPFPSLPHTYCSQARTTDTLNVADVQIYPKLYMSGSMYSNRWWQVLVAAWELLVSSPLRWVLPALLAALLVWRLCGQRIRRRLQNRRDKALRLGSLNRDLAV